MEMKNENKKESKRSKKRRCNEDKGDILNQAREGIYKIKGRLEYRGIIIGLNRGKQINEERRNEKYNIEEIQSLK